MLQKSRNHGHLDHVLGDRGPGVGGHEPSTEYVGPASAHETVHAPPRSERRRFPRVELALTVGLRFASAEAACDCRTVDISEGGVFIRMDRPRPEGTSIRIQLQVGDRVLSIGGVVVRSIRPGEGSAPGIGVLFTELSPEDRSFVQQMVSERLDD